MVLQSPEDAIGSSNVEVLPSFGEQVDPAFGNLLRQRPESNGLHLPESSILRFQAQGVPVHLAATNSSPQSPVGSPAFSAERPSRMNRPRAPARTANVSGHGPRSPAQDRTITLVKQLGRRRWKKASGYPRQGRVENTFLPVPDTSPSSEMAFAPGAQQRGEDVQRGAPVRAVRP